MEGAGYDEGDYIPCEIGKNDMNNCTGTAQDTHHIDARGMGGNPSGDKDMFANLMGLCRNCHNDYGDVSLYKDMLRNIHKKRFSHKPELFT